MDTPPPDRIQLADEVFTAALDLPPAERAAFVRERCGDDTTLTDTVLHLLSQYERLGDFLEAPAFAPSQPPPGEFRPGELLNNGRFRLLEMVGRGGMGEVYRAEDTELADVVALKVLRSRFRGEENVDARFRGEIRLARKISHPNVCHIYDLFVETRGADVVLYFTMEFLEGQTLAHAIAQGPMDPPAALVLARQIAAGLDAVHHAGLIHRDLKPANILLVPDLAASPSVSSDRAQRAVLTDFGLAKVFDGITPSGHTLPGQIVGTPEYMAPEQFLGAHLTPTTDIFSFGLIVREMLSGRRPPPEENVVRLAMRRMSEPPEPLSRSLPKVPAAWDAVFARALAPDPQNRYASAAEMIRALEGPAAPAPPSAPVPCRISRRTWIVSGAATAGVACLGALLRYREWMPALPAKPLVMLTPTTQSIDSSDGPTAAGAIDLLLADQLQQSAHIRILSKDRMQAAWQRIAGAAVPLPAKLTPAQARDIALREGAQFVVFSSLSRVADEQVLDLRLQLMSNDPAHARKEWPSTFSARHMTDLPSAVYDSAAWVRRTAGESAGAIETRSRHPEELTTSSWQALQEYTLGDEAWRASKSDAAILHLKTALEFDPSFALAAARLADILDALGRTDEGLQYYEQAESLLLKKGLTDRESLRIRGAFALDTGRFADAEHVFALYADNYPADALPLFYRSDALYELGRREEAARLLDMAINMAPDSYPFLFRRAHVALDEGRWDESDKDLLRLARLSDHDWTDRLRSALSFSRLEFERSQESLERMRTTGSPPFVSKAYVMEACFRAEQGRFDEARRLFEDGLSFDRRMGLTAETQFAKQRQLARLFLAGGDSAGARRICREVLKAKPGLETTLQVACELARAGDLPAAEACLPQREPKWPFLQYWLSRLRGEIALARGNPKLALKLIDNNLFLRITGEWPAYLVRAARAAGEAGIVNDWLDALFQNPGKFWFYADLTEPGAIRWATGLAATSRMTPARPEAAKSLRALANFLKETSHGTH